MGTRGNIASKSSNCGLRGVLWLGFAVATSEWLHQVLRSCCWWYAVLGDAWGPRHYSSTRVRGECGTALKGRLFWPDCPAQGDCWYGSLYAWARFRRGERGARVFGKGLAYLKFSPCNH